MTHLQPLLLIIIAILVLRYLLDLAVDLLNLRSIKEELPDEFEGWYDGEKYLKSQRYLRATTSFGIISDSFSTAVTIAFVLAGGFNLFDRAARSLAGGNHEIIAGLIFIGLLSAASMLISLPFSIYSTFVIEERYGFNRTTPKTFVLDLLKGIMLAVILGGPILALVLWFFQATGSYAWLWCWIAVTVIQIFMLFLAPYVILPLFNKFTPLEEGELRDKVEEYARKENFTMRGIFTMDGSKRSSKSNAFFTGFGKSRRIVLFDTLIEAHPVDELLAIIAHEMGHYKHRHILKAILRGILTTGLTFCLMSLCIGSRALFEAFGMEHISVYAALVFFGFLYTPLSIILNVAGNIISRRHEFQADAYAVQSTGNAEAMINSLKRLTVKNLGNLSPHPLNVFLNYSHPPILERICAIRRSK